MITNIRTEPPPVSRGASKYDPSAQAVSEAGPGEWVACDVTLENIIPIVNGLRTYMRRRGTPVSIRTMKGEDSGTVYVKLKE